MSPERWRQIKDILNGALELQSEQREAYLLEACNGDAELRQEIESLIASYEHAGDVLENTAVPSAASSNPDLGRRIGQYRIVEQIGRGGMGAVFRAVRDDAEFRQVVAIKILRRAMDHDFLIRRFRHERQILASLDHPNIAKLLDGGTTDDGLPYFVMEFIHGKPVDEYCDEKRLSMEQRLKLFRTICSAVQCAHDAQIIHRDIKPGNILITADSTPKLLDFGIAKIHNPDITPDTIAPTVTVERIMTPEYASPEQVRGEPVTAATDVYSLGILLYELLTGHRPYQIKGRAPHEIAQAICEVEPQRPSTAISRVETVTRGTGQTHITITPEMVSKARASEPDKLRRMLTGDLDNIILMAMRKEPERRYRTVAEFSEDVSRYLGGLPVTARKDTVVYRAAKFVQRHKADLAIIGVAAPLLAALIVAAIYFTGGALPTAQTIPGSARVLTNFPGNETQPSFSPDGKRVAFVWAGEANDNFDIYVKSVNGSDLTRITMNPADDSSPAWSPDGSRIAFLRSSKTETAIFVAPVGGGIHGKVADILPGRIETVGRHLAWSPDGNYIAIGDRTRTDEPFAIYLIKADSSERRKLTNPPKGIIGDSTPALSPDGRLLAFVRSLSSGVGELFVVPVAGGEPKRLTVDERTVLGLTFTPDSSSIVFSSNRMGTQVLWRIPVDGGTPERVAGVNDSTSDPIYSQGVSGLAFSQYFNDTNIWRIEIVPGTTRTVGFPKQLISSPFYDAGPQYSPDGKHIVFRSSRSGNNEIWMVNSEGVQSRQLTNFGGPLTGTPRWSPDSRKVVFDSRPEGRADLFVVDIAGGEPRPLMRDQYEDVVASWSRDGKWIYFASNRSGTSNVWKISEDGNVLIQLTTDGGFAPIDSADGKFVYYAKGRSVPGLWRVPSNGGREELVFAGLAAGAWGSWGLTPTGVYYTGRESEANRFSIYFYSFATRQSTRVMPIDKPARLGSSTFAVSPDGRYILYTQVDQSGSDIMLLE